MDVHIVYSLARTRRSRHTTLFFTLSLSVFALILSLHVSVQLDCKIYCGFLVLRISCFLPHLCAQFLLMLFEFFFFCWWIIQYNFWCCCFMLALDIIIIYLVDGYIVVDYMGVAELYAQIPPKYISTVLFDAHLRDIIHSHDDDDHRCWSYARWSACSTTTIWGFLFLFISPFFHFLQRQPTKHQVKCGELDWIKSLDGVNVKEEQNQNPRLD